MLKNNIQVFLSSDNNYAPFVAVTIASICDNTKSFVDFYILDGGITKENQNKIKDLKKKFDNFSIKFIKIDTEKHFSNFIPNSYLTLAAYYRFLIPDLFPNITKGIYLDVDIILKGDISKLFSEDLETYALGAIIDQGNKPYIGKLKANMDMDLYSNYFNSGVMLINLEKWRKNNVLKALFQIQKQYKDKLLCGDQDILNKYFENNYKILERKYNSMFEYNDTIIRHFTFKEKPWHFAPEVCTQKCPEYAIFWKYAKLTAFFNEIKASCKYTTAIRIQLLNLMERKIQEKEINSASNPRISVIIPVYNCDKYLRRCLDSICYQTLDAVEIICVNDCSADNSLEIMKEYARFDGRIKIIDFKKNKGVAYARNEGIKLAKGEYIAFVDPDDYLDLDFYEKLNNAALETKSDIIKANRKTQELDKHLEIESLNAKIHKNNDNKFYFTYQFTTAIYKANLIKENQIIFPENLSNTEDIVFLLRVLLKAKSFEIIDNTFYNYIRRKNSLNAYPANKDAIKSFLAAAEKLCTILNNAYLKEINNKDYHYLYCIYLDTILNSFFRCNNDNDKKLCCIKLVELYEKYIKDEEANKAFLKTPWLIDLITAKNTKALLDELNKYNSFNETIIANLRKNIKKDMVNA